MPSPPQRGSPFPCDYPGCTTTFSRTRDLKRHQLNFHNRKMTYCNQPGCLHLELLPVVLEIPEDPSWPSWPVARLLHMHRMPVVTEHLDQLCSYCGFHNSLSVMGCPFHLGCPPSEQPVTIATRQHAPSASPSSYYVQRRTSIRIESTTFIQYCQAPGMEYST